MSDDLKKLESIVRDLCLVSSGWHSEDEHVRYMEAKCRIWDHSRETMQTHSEECWRWHHLCAVARIERDTALLRQALEALENYAMHKPLPGPCPVRHAENALRERLAEKEQ